MARIEHGMFRATLWRLWIDLLREVHKHQLPGRKFGEDLHLIVIYGAIFALYVEGGRPVRASKVAAFLDFPRETMRRRITELVQLGLLAPEDHGYRPTPRSIPRLQEIAVSILQQGIAKILEIK